MITKIVSKMRKTTDFIELRMRSVFQILLDSGEISKAVEMLEEINTNFLFSTFCILNL